MIICRLLLGNNSTFKIENSKLLFHSSIKTRIGKKLPATSDERHITRDESYYLMIICRLLLGNNSTFKIENSKLLFHSSIKTRIGKKLPATSDERHITRDEFCNPKNQDLQDKRRIIRITIFNMKKGNSKFRIQNSKLLN